MAETTLLIDEISQRIKDHIEREQREKPKARKLGDALPNVDALTPDYMTEVLQVRWPAAVVDALTVDSVSEGTHHRHRIRMTVSGDDAAPTSLFTKSLPTLEVRMIAGITGHVRAEARFYDQIRPELDIEAPDCFVSWFDRESLAGMHILEDLVATKQATFCNYETYVTEAMATEQMQLLGKMHGQLLDDARFENEWSWVTPFDRWFDGGIAKLGIDKYHEEAMLQAADRIPAALMDKRPALWDAAIASLQPHRDGPVTFLHSDVHIGNWYQTGDGHMGLCDWQCVGRGHWSRDLAYALTAALQVEDRRAWEEGLVRTYAAALSEASTTEVSFDEAFLGYRRQIPHALLMWTPTLCHSDLLPHMQSDETSLAMIERMCAAIDDLDSIGANA
ncbi:MAG TPA: aminoglycoside phosphotransferase family protein [Acidimicrobiales bacterium]|nr:aminoglycoside phosphotransferase family protein [Acidimicrobiales bacterium]